MRERGLKFIDAGVNAISCGSLPMRERGLKFVLVAELGDISGSLPMRERGLKYLDAADHGEHGLVAPPAGAWNEIRSGRCKKRMCAGRSPCGSVD